MNAMFLAYHEHQSLERGSFTIWGKEKKKRDRERGRKKKKESSPNVLKSS